jgi:SAM-dependent methyltransferase
MTGTKHAWQGAYAARWLRSEAQKDRQLGPLGQSALDALAAQPGEHILDVGCGAGSTLLPLARAVGNAGHVLGVDISLPMLERAKARCAEAGLHNVDLAHGDAATLLLEGRYDGMFSRFGVMFFEEPVAAFRHLRDALVPGGRLAFVCWQGIAANPWAQRTLACVMAEAPHLPLPDMFQPGLPGPFRYDAASTLERTLTTAGYSEVEVRPLVRDVCLGAHLDEAVDLCMETGPSGRFVEGVATAARGACRSALTRLLEAHTRPDGTWLEAAVFIVTARAP